MVVVAWLPRQKMRMSSFALTKWFSCYFLIRFGSFGPSWPFEPIQFEPARPPEIMGKAQEPFWSGPAPWPAARAHHSRAPLWPSGHLLDACQPPAILVGA